MLSNEAIAEIENALYGLVSLLARDNPILRLQMRNMRGQLRQKLLENREEVEKNVMEPLHYFMHEHNIQAVEKKAESVEGALNEIAQHPTN